MSGFKSGASGDDPFGSGTESDDGGGEDETTDARAGTGQSPETGSSSEPDAESSPDPGAESESKPTVDGDSTSDSAATEPIGGGLPWIYKRDSISDDRPKTVQLHLQESTLDRQRESRRNLESELGESVKKADLREAALLVGMTRIDEVADVLRSWGYDFE